MRRLVWTASTALFVVAVVKELRIPATQRAWHGRIGVVPYDLRPPTPARLRVALWNPDDPRVLTPQAFGVGWSLNMGRIWRLVSHTAR